MMLRGQAEKFIGIEIFVKDIVADARPFWLFVWLPDLVVALGAEESHSRCAHVNTQRYGE